MTRLNAGDRMALIVGTGCAVILTTAIWISQNWEIILEVFNGAAI